MRIPKLFPILIILLLSILILRLRADHSTIVFEQNLYKQFDECAQYAGTPRQKACFSTLILDYYDQDPATIPRINTILLKYIDDEKTPLDYVRQHTIFHEVGMSLYVKIKDPKEAYALCENSESDSGCHNSVIMTYADGIKDTEYDPIKLIDEICSIDTPQGRILSHPKVCMHSIGHVSIYKRYGDLPKALEDCDRTPEEHREECYRGLFMEYADGQSQLGVHSHTSDDIPLPCETLPVKYQPECYLTMGSTNPAFSENRENFAAVSEICNQAGDFIFDCYQGMTRRLIRTNKKHLSKVKIVCDGLPKNSSSLCHQAVIHNLKTYPHRYIRSSERFDICGRLETNLAGKCTLANAEYLKLKYGLN